MAVFDAAGSRLGATGPAAVAVGQPLTLRASVGDFETDDAAMRAVGFSLFTSDDALVLLPNAVEGKIEAVFDDVEAPMGTKDVLDWRATLSLPETVTLLDEGGRETQAASGGLSIYVYASYRDGTGADSIAAYAMSDYFLEVDP